MNNRASLHVLALVATALAGGTVVFFGVDEIVTKNIAAVATLVSIAVNGYLTGTTSGAAKE